MYPGRDMLSEPLLPTLFRNPECTSTAAGPQVHRNNSLQTRTLFAEIR